MHKRLYYWLMLCGLTHCAAGLLFIGVIATPLAQPYIQQLAVTLSRAESSHGLVPILQFFGPTVASWGLLFCAVIHGYWLTAAPQLRWMAIVSVLLWLIFDCGLSAWYGITAHFLVNGIAALAILPALWLLRLPKNA